MAKVRPKAIDLYSGVGGWTLGLKLAGVNVIAAYDCSPQANLTYERNLGLRPLAVDLRTFPAESLPRDVDFVVGSPPCTRFSFSNRGGNGDMKDGLEDLRVFLEAIRTIGPRHWVMENIPRVAGILRQQISRGGLLHEFRELVDVITVLDMSSYGLPQRRRRMFAGSFPLDLLESYAGKEPADTLGAVIDALRNDLVVDPLYGLETPAAELHGNEREAVLDEEEIRLNSQAKQAHRVYNRMAFPDPLDRTARTVTAVCTRVSRESIVVDDPNYGMRRLTLRERSTLQGFPTTFQFFGTSVTNQQKLVGNAMPPFLAYYVAQSMKGTPPGRVDLPRRWTSRYRAPSETPAMLPTSSTRRPYPIGRRFRSVIPGLGFGSGVRFELTNRVENDEISWRVCFLFGTPKDIREHPLDSGLLSRSRALVSNGAFQRRIEMALRSLESCLKGAIGQSIQRAWNHSGPGIHPFRIADKIGEAARGLHASVPRSAWDEIVSFVLDELIDSSRLENPRPAGKLKEKAGWIYSGFVLGSWLNSASSLVNPAGSN
jgi:DNA (cytosine-5)-methyltransferase 1